MGAVDMKGCPYCHRMSERVVGTRPLFTRSMNVRRVVSCDCGTVDRTVALYPFLAQAPARDAREVGAEIHRAMYHH